MIDLKQLILDGTNNGLDVLLSLYPDAKDVIYNGAQKFKIRSDERTPSATIRKRKDKSGTEMWYVCDFGDDAHEINCFDAWMKENCVSYFSECLYQIADQFGIDYKLKPEINKPKREEWRDIEDDSKAKEGDFSYKAKEEPSAADLKVWGPFVKKETLEKYKYLSLEWYKKVSRSKKTGRLVEVTVTASDDFPIFMREYGDCRKVYCPLAYDKAKRFFWNGNKPQNLINGLKEAEDAMAKATADKLDDTKPEKLPALFICSGERDAMNLAGMGYWPVWLNSETADLSEKDLASFYKVARKVYNIPDIDTTGIRQGEKLALKHLSVYTIELPKWLLERRDNRGKPRKDLRDFLELRPSNNEFKKLMDMATCACFWKEKESEKGTKIEIMTTRLLYYLRLNGFYKLKDQITGETKPCRVDGYKVDSLEPEQLRDFIRHDLRERQVSNRIMEVYINSKKASKSIYEDLETIELSFDVRTATSRTLFFDNCQLNITGTDIQTTTTKDIKSYCWQKKIIPHKFTRTAPAFHMDEDGRFYIDSLASKCLCYMINGSRIYWREELENRVTGDEVLDTQYAAENKFTIYGPRLTKDEMLEQLQNLVNKIYVIGFLLHHYKVDDMAKCVWVMESKITQEDESSGGSGKSFFMRMLKYLKLASFATLDGRDTDLTKNTHFLDRVSSETDIMLIDDAAKNFDFNSFYGKITGQLTINPKNLASFEIDYRDSPHTVITSNFPFPDADSRSTIRRILPVVFGDYYHEQGSDGEYRETRKISTDFDGKNLFAEDYSEEEYNADYNFMIDCIQFYLRNKNQVFMPPMDKIMERARRSSAGDSFIEWADEYFAADEKHPDQDKLDVLLIKNVAYQDYCDSLGKSGKNKNPQNFKTALRTWCKLRGYIYCPPELDGYNAEKKRIIRNILWGSKRKAQELIYIQTPNAPINNETPSDWGL